MIPETISKMHDPDTGVLIESRYFRDREPSFWVQSGVGAIEFTEDGLMALRDMLNEYWEEEES